MQAFDRHRPSRDSSHADERDLRRVDDAVHLVDSLVSEARDGDRRIGHLRAPQMSATSSLHHVAQLAHERVEVLLVDVVDRGRDKPTAAERHRDAEVHVRRALQAIVEPEAVDLGHLAGLRARPP